MGHRHIGQSVIVVMVAFLVRVAVAVAVAVDDDEALLPAAEELIASCGPAIQPTQRTTIKLARITLQIILASTFPAHGRNYVLMYGLST